MSGETQPEILSGNPDRQQAISHFMSVTLENPGTMRMVLDPELYDTAIAPEDWRIEQARAAAGNLIAETKNGLYLAFDSATEASLTADPQYLAAERALSTATDPEARNAARHKLALLSLRRFVERATYIPGQRQPWEPEATA